MNSREAALRRLEEFLHRVPFYGRDRNYDRPGHEAVSRLSLWIRYRVITEEECARAVLSRHSIEVAEKFVQEVLWRTYWKGWLEMRPRVWSQYVGEVERLEGKWRANERYQAACEGRTDLEFFNDWVNELIATGYLHNHTRMWFASVWIFTLQLPWQLGAAFMFHHLLDADPASNTLSWRWVGGLHTPGKIYLARPDNIAKFSEGRWRPKTSELVPDARPLVGDSSVVVTPLQEVPSAPPPPGSLVLIHDDDLTPDLSGELGSPEFGYVVLNSEKLQQSERVLRHRMVLRNDTAHRARAPLVSTSEEIITLMEDVGVNAVHAFLPPVGYDRDMVMQIADQLTQEGFSMVWYRRSWDARYLPLARTGFFPFWQQVRRGLADG